MSEAAIAAIVAIGAAAWIYGRFMRTTGNQTQRSLTAAAISGVVIFFLVLIIFSMIF